MEDQSPVVKIEPEFYSTEVVEPKPEPIDNNYEPPEEINNHQFRNPPQHVYKRRKVRLSITKFIKLIF